VNRLMLIVSMTAVLFASACASPTVKTTALAPAKFHEAAKLKEVAVLPFDGADGMEIAAEIEGVLAAINIGDKQYFTLVDRTRLDRIISEMKLTQSALVDPNTAASLGKMVGAKGIYTGVVTVSNISNSYYSEDRSKCVQTQTKYDKKGRPYEGPCIKWSKYTVNCIKRIANLSVTPKLIEVETGRVVYANNISGTASSSACQDSAVPLANPFELMQMARQSVKHKFRTDVAPYYITFEIKLMDSTEGIGSKESEKKFEQGIDFAKNNRLDRACELWGEARILSPNSASILYNLGICAEMVGDLEQAYDLYKKADRQMGRPDEKVSSALYRVSAQIQQQKKLREEMAK